MNIIKGTFGELLDMNLWGSRDCFRQQAEARRWFRRNLRYGWIQTRDWSFCATKTSPHQSYGWSGICMNPNSFCVQPTMGLWGIHPSPTHPEKLHVSARQRRPLPLRPRAGRAQRGLPRDGPCTSRVRPGTSSLVPLVGGVEKLSEVLPV